MHHPLRSCLGKIRWAMENGDSDLAYKLLVDTGVVPKLSETSGGVESENSETPEVSSTPEPAARSSSWEVFPRVEWTHVREMAWQRVPQGASTHAPQVALQCAAVAP